MVLPVGLVVALAAGCAPSRDWRVMQPEGWLLSVSMPCRPSRQERTIDLDGVPAAMTMLSCADERHTLAVASVVLADPSRVARTLAWLVASAQANVQGAVVAEQAAKVPGMTPFEQAREVRLQGRRPDGQSVQMQVLVFAHGMRVYQATVIGASISDEDVRPLFDSLVVKP